MILIPWTYEIKRPWTYEIKRPWSYEIKRPWTYEIKKPWTYEIKRPWTYEIKRPWTYEIKRPWTYEIKRGLVILAWKIHRWFLLIKSSLINIYSCHVTIRIRSLPHWGPYSSSYPPPMNSFSTLNKQVFVLFWIIKGTRLVKLQIIKQLSNVHIQRDITNKILLSRNAEQYETFLHLVSTDCKKWIWKLCYCSKHKRPKTLIIDLWTYGYFCG